MRLSSIILAIAIILSFSGCYYGSKTYEIFEYQKNSFVSREMSLIGLKAYIKKEYNNDEYIYRGSSLF